MPTQKPLQQRSPPIEVGDVIFTDVEASVQKWGVQCINQIEHYKLNQFTFDPNDFSEINHAIKKWMYGMLLIMQKAPVSFERFVFYVTDTLEPTDICEEGGSIRDFIEVYNGSPYSKEAKNKLFQIVREELKYIYNYAGAGYILETLKKHHPKRLQRIALEPTARKYIEEFEGFTNPNAAPVELYCYVFYCVSSFDTNFW